MPNWIILYVTSLIDKLGSWSFTEGESKTKVKTCDGFGGLQHGVCMLTYCVEFQVLLMNLHSSNSELPYFWEAKKFL